MQLCLIDLFRYFSRANYSRGNQLKTWGRQTCRSIWVMLQWKEVCYEMLFEFDKFWYFGANKCVSKQLQEMLTYVKDVKFPSLEELALGVVLWLNLVFRKQCWWMVMLAIWFCIDTTANFDLNLATAWTKCIMKCVLIFLCAEITFKPFAHAT